MPKTYSWHFKVRSYEIDQFGIVNNAIYLNYLEESATQASADAGYSLNWYLENNYFWLVRKWTIRYFQPAVYGDELEVTTWVSDLRRVRSNREYMITRLSDNAQIARARTDWVFVDATTQRPVRILPQFHDAFQPPDEPLEDLGIRIRNATPVPNSYRFESYRKVQSHELDRVQHVNNTVYLHWIEHAYNLALEAVNYSVKSQLSEHHFGILAAAHEIEYFKPAKEGDRIKIISWVTEKARVRGAWYHEIRDADSDELLALDYAVGAFLDFSGDQPKPTRIPQPLFKACITGIPDEKNSG